MRWLGRWLGRWFDGQQEPVNSRWGGRWFGRWFDVRAGERTPPSTPIVSVRGNGATISVRANGALVAMSDFTIKQGDLEPSLFATISDSSGSVPPLSSAESVQLRFATVQGEELFLRDMTVQDSDSGLIFYAWQEGDTDVAGLYYAEIVVVWPGARTQTYPQEGYLVITFQNRLGLPVLQ